MRATSILRSLCLALSLAFPGFVLADEAPEGAPLSASPEAAQSTPPAVMPPQPLTSQILYQYVLAELAAKRGDPNLAVKAMLDLAKKTNDGRIARRAGEMAFLARRPDAAVEAVQLWVSIDPNSTDARRTAATMLLNQGLLAEAAPHLSRLLELEDKELSQNLLGLNRLLFRHGNRIEALALVEKLTAPYGRVPEAHLAVSVAAQSAGKDARALEAVDKALSLRPAWEAAAIWKSRLLGAPDAKAVQYLEGFLRDNSDAYEARMILARTLVGANRHDEALSQFRLLLKQKPDDSDVLYAVAMLALQQGDKTEAEKQFKQLLTRDPAQANPVRLYLGQIAEESKRDSEALQWYLAAEGDQLAAARTRAALVYVRQGKLEDALQTLRDAEAAQPQETLNLQIAQAQVLKEAGRTLEAYALLEARLKVDPEQPDLLYETALLAERIGRFEVMEQRLRRVIQLRPENAHAYNALGYSFADRNERLEEARKLIDHALKLAPEDPFILDSKGWVLFRAGDAKGAESVLRHAMEKRADPEIAAHLGEVLWTLGRRDEARRTWKDAARDNPGNESLVSTIKRFEP